MWWRSSGCVYLHHTSTTPSFTSLMLFTGETRGRASFTGSPIKNVNKVRDDGDEKLKLMWYFFPPFPTPLTGINQLYVVYTMHQSEKLMQPNAALRDIHILIEFLCRIGCRSSFPKTTAQLMCWKRLSVLFLHHRVLFCNFFLLMCV